LPFVRIWLRFTLLAAAFCALNAASAGAAEVPVLHPGGKVTHRWDPGVAARAGERPAAPARTHAGVRAATASKRRTVIGELKRLRDAGAIDDLAYADRRAAYEDAKAFAKRLAKGSRRRIEMTAVVGLLDSFAARRLLTASRLAPLWLTLERNREWWSKGPLLGSGQRVDFANSEVVWQYVPGQGLQIHPLANFGKLNALWKSQKSDDRLAVLLDELVALGVERAGGLAWEYYYSFGGGRPPWVSGLAQGTALQALARAGIRLQRKDEILAIARRGLGIFQQPPPQGVRVGADGGAHYLQYSFNRGLFIFNGFTQALVGLNDFGAYANDDEAKRLFADGERAALQEIPRSDTGGWSLYSEGARESTLDYHKLYLGFLRNLCERTLEPAFCDTAEHFEDYLTEDPQLQLLSRTLRGGTTAAIRFKLSKISRVGVRVTRGDRVLLSRAALMSHGGRTVGWAVPRKPGEYEVRLTAVDLAGNASSVTEPVEVLKPRKKKH
jgi:hypothetical protein